jgi:EAL and modified HD-GYP domain-containing signal transduction protein
VKDIYLARQPIVDDRNLVVGFELLFRSGNEDRAGVRDNTGATASVLVNAFGELGVDRVLGPHRGFINVDAEFLHSDLVELLPRQQVVLEVLEREAVDAALVRRCRDLKEKGYVLALDDVVELTDDERLLLPVMDVVKLDLVQIGATRLPAMVDRLRGFPVRLLAEKVEDREQARRCARFGCSMFQGYYFAHPENLTGKRVDPSKLTLLRLLQLTLDDAEIAEIEAVFKESPGLAYSLLRIVNSAAGAPARRIATLQQGLLFLGRRPLQRWVQLLLYADGGMRCGASATRLNPLMQLAATRGKLMENASLIRHAGDRSLADRAFLVGVLSLLDALLDVPMSCALAPLNLEDDVRSALLDGAGELGTLLRLCTALESNEDPGAHGRLAEGAGLELGALRRAELDAMAWANSLG